MAPRRLQAICSTTRIRSECKILPISAHLGLKLCIIVVNDVFRDPFDARFRSPGDGNRDNNGDMPLPLGANEAVWNLPVLEEIALTFSLFATSFKS